jgi:hypothetical protein
VACPALLCGPSTSPLEVMDESHAIRSLELGRQLLASTLESHGFAWVPGSAGKGSGGHFASGAYIRGDRRLELHFRLSLGLVTYHLGSVSISHDDFMRYTGHGHDAKYPGFSSDPLDAFRDLASDLASFGGDFLSGDGSQLVAAKAAADAAKNLSGFEQLGQP